MNDATQEPQGIHAHDLAEKLTAFAMSLPPDELAMLHSMVLRAMDPVDRVAYEQPEHPYFTAAEMTFLSAMDLRAAHARQPTRGEP